MVKMQNSRNFPSVLPIKSSAPLNNSAFLPFMKKLIRWCHSIYRLVIRNIQGYSTFQVQPKGTKRAPDVAPDLDILKARVLDLLLLKQSKRKTKLINWSIAWETHISSGLPHLDLLIVYQKNITPVHTSFDYLIKDLNIQQRDVGDQIGTGHVWVTPYSPKKLNKAILDYGQKEDPVPITNLTLQRKQQLIQVNLLKADPYRYLELQMRKDPLRFNLQQYCQKHDLYQYISSWSSIKNKLKDSQTAAANLELKSKPGFKFISKQLIESQLNKDELAVFYSWKGYQKIVDYLNQMILQKGRRDPKTLNLLITGAPNTGKSALIWHPNPHDHFNPISKYCSVYPIGMSQWFPKYSSDVYHCIYWNQAKLTSYSYDTVLKLLDGSPLDLNTKGSVSRKVDNPLIIMTSNLTLDQMITQKFGYNKDYVKMARANLAVRVQNVVVPKGHNLFLLQKLLVQA